MIELLYALLLSEMAMLLLLLLSPSARKPVVFAIDHAKRGHNFRVVSITVLSYLLVLLFYNIYSIVKVLYRINGSNLVDPLDQIIIAEKLLSSSLLGFLLFLYVVICNLHELIMDWCLVEGVTQAEQKQLAKWNLIARESIKASMDEITDLKLQMKKLESVLEARNRKIKSAEAEVSTLRKQSEDVNMKYDELIEYNETIRNQLQCMIEHKQQQEEEEYEEESVWPNLKSTNITCGGGFIQFPWNNNQKSNTTKTVVGPEIELQTTINRTSSARHRQPIYIVDTH